MGFAVSIETTLSVDDVAAIVDRSPDWIKRRAPKFEHLRVGRSIRFTPDQAEAFVRSFTVRPAESGAPPVGEADPLREQTSKSRSRSK